MINSLDLINVQEIGGQSFSTLSDTVTSAMVPTETIEEPFDAAIGNFNLLFGFFIYF